MYIEKTLQEVLADIDPAIPLAWDTETCGFYGKIRLAQFYQANWDKVVLVNWPNALELTTVLAKAKVIAYNAHYDVTTIQAQTNSRYEPPSYDDLFYLARLHFYNQFEYSLDDVLTYHLGYCPYTRAGLDKAVLQSSNWNVPVLTEQQKLYAAMDVLHLPSLYERINSYCNDTSYKLDMLCLHYALDFQCNGMHVLSHEVQRAYQENLNELAKLAIPINVNSYQQVRPYIGSNQSDGLGLATLALQGNEKAGNVRNARKLLKLNSFLSKFDTQSDYIYGKFLPSARSGRFTSKDQNLQQIPRKLKKVFGYTPEDGKVYLYADFAQLEMRTICAIIGEPAMEKILREGGDLHNFAAALIFSKDFTPTQRQITKTANFNLLYGGGVNMFLSILIEDAGLLLSEQEGALIKRKWKSIFTSIGKWHDAAIRAYKNGDAWATPFGRRYVAKLMTDQCNLMNQGFGAEVAKLAMHYMMPKLKELEPLGVKFSNFCHDSYLVECPDDPELYKPASIIIAESMQKAWFEALRVGNALKIRNLPMPVKVNVGYNWSTIEKDFVHEYKLTGMEFYETI